MAKQTTSSPQGKTVSSSRPLRAKTAAGGHGGGGDSVAGRLARRPSLLTYVEQSWSELRKVTWPTPRDTTNLTIAVIVMTMAIAAFLGLVDSALAQVVQFLIG